MCASPQIEPGTLPSDPLKGTVSPQRRCVAFRFVPKGTHNIP